MYYFKKLNENYFIYIILIFIFIPLNFIPQLFGGVMFEYAYEIGDLSAIDNWYKEMSRHVQLLFIYLVDLLTKYTSLPSEIFRDNLAIIFLILLCIEVKKYSKILFGLENKWCNLAALFTAIFPIWHTLVDFEVTLYFITSYLVLFGFRNFASKKKINIIIGLIFIILSFDLESNFSFVIGLAIIHLLLNKVNSTYYFSVLKLITIIAISIGYYLIKQLYFPPSGAWQNYIAVDLSDFSSKVAVTQFIKNILNYSTYLFLYLWIPIVFILHLLFINKKYFSEIKLILIEKFSFEYTNNYLLLIILSGFAIFPYLLINKSSTILYLADYYQRHALLLAPIFGMFFSIMFRDMNKINCFQNKANLNFYLIVFICMNLVLLNYGNYRKTESHLFRSNLINELKAYGSIPKGNVQLVSKNFPADFRSYEINFLMYKAYNVAGWWGSTSLINPTEPPGPNKHVLNDEIYLSQWIINEYKHECDIYIYLKNDLTKYERLKKFYIFNYKKNFNIDKVIKKC